MSHHRISRINRTLVDDPTHSHTLTQLVGGFPQFLHMFRIAGSLRVSIQYLFYLLCYKSLLLRTWNLDFHINFLLVLRSASVAIRASRKLILSAIQVFRLIQKSLSVYRRVYCNCLDNFQYVWIHSDTPRYIFTVKIQQKLFTYIFYSKNLAKTVQYFKFWSLFPPLLSIH